MSNIQYLDNDDAKHGKRKGSVYQSGTQLFAQRRRVNARDPKTGEQQINRDCVQWVSRNWKLLTADQRTAWHTIGADGYFGFYAFMHINLPNCGLGLPIIPDPPTDPVISADASLYALYNEIANDFEYLSSPQTNRIDIYFRTL